MKRLLVILGGIPVVAILGSLGLFLFSTVPANAEASDLRAEIKETRDRIRKATEQAHEVRRFMAGEAGAIRKAMRFVDRRVGTESRAPELYPMFAAIAEKAGIRLHAISVPFDPALMDDGADDGPALEDLPPEDAAAASKTVERPPLYTALPFTITTQGPPERILDFIGLLRKHPRPIAITQVEVSRHEKQFLRVRAEIRLNVVVPVSSRGD